MPGFEFPVYSNFPFLHNVIVCHTRILSNPVPDDEIIYNILIIKILKKKENSYNKKPFQNERVDTIIMTGFLFNLIFFQFSVQSGECNS